MKNGDAESERFGYFMTPMEASMIYPGADTIQSTKIRNQQILVRSRSSVSDIHLQFTTDRY